MIELIENEIMDSGAPVHWDDIAGLEFAKNTIKEIVVWPMLRPDIFTGLRGPPRGISLSLCRQFLRRTSYTYLINIGILLFGPPGTGKTLIGEKKENFYARKQLFKKHFCTHRKMHCKPIQIYFLQHKRIFFNFQVGR